MFVGEAEFGIQISQLKLSIAETKGIKRSKLAKTLLDALVPKEVQLKSTVFGTADGKLPLDQKLVAAIKCKIISVEISKGSLQNWKVLLDWCQTFLRKSCNMKSLAKVTEEFNSLRSSVWCLVTYYSLRKSRNKL